MNNQPDSESIIRQRLEEIRVVPERSPQAAALGRARFLAQAVSVDELQRHKGWKSIFRKEKLAMNLMIAVLLVAGLVFGGGATVNAARDDLPNEPLYALKTWSEEISLGFQDTPQAKADRLMELAQLRVQEMTRMVESGQVPPERVRLRLEQHIQQTLQLCSSMEDAELDRTLLRLRDRLQQHDRDLQQLQIHAGQDTQPILAQTRTMLRTRLQLADEGLLNHEAFRERMRNGFQYGGTHTPPAPLPSSSSTPKGPQPGPATPQPDPGSGIGPGPNPDPGGPNPGVTPGTGGGSGPNPNGPGDNEPGGNDPGGGGPGGNQPGNPDSGGGDGGGNNQGGGGSGGNGP